MQWDYSNVKVGDTVWYDDVNGRGAAPTETTVVKVGSKLITTQRIVFRKDTGRTNDNYGHQSLILDIEAYEAEKRANKAWYELHQQRSRPAGVTYADIREAAKILKITILT